ncbi:MAG: hypothetical protein LBN21_08500 [Treponema sp.]|jgi:hypothetical protein|nr:hypothetical protein [Treponema sp.]
MKKITVIVLVTALAALPLSAQNIGIGGWARYYISPIGGTGTFGEDFDKDTLYASTEAHTVSKFPQRGKIGLATWGNSDYVGFNFDFAYQNAKLEVGDQAQVWVRLNDTFMFHAGKIQGNVLRGKIEGGQMIAMEEEDDIFLRFYPQTGMLLDITPLENLYLGASVDTGGKLTDTAENIYDFKSTAGSGFQLGAGYWFDDLGHLRVQYISFNDGKPIQAAFALTSIYNLILEVGGRFPMNPTKTSPKAVTVAAQYNLEQLSLMGRVTGNVFDDGFQFKAGSVVKYSINFPLFLGLEASYAADDPTTIADDDVIQLAPYAGFKFGRGELRIGLFGEASLTGEKQTYRFEFPILFEVKFF